MRADKPDRTTSAIVEELRARGYLVEYAKGMPFDLVVIGWHRWLETVAVCLVEVKNGSKFTPREIAFQDELRAKDYHGIYIVATGALAVLAFFGDAGL